MGRNIPCVIAHKIVPIVTTTASEEKSVIDFDQVCQLDQVADADENKVS